jgi:hypothetical protein
MLAGRAAGIQEGRVAGMQVGREAGGPSGRLRYRQAERQEGKLRGI